MKKKIFLAVIAVLVLCLTCGMLLVACNDDKPNPDDDIDTPVVPPEEDLSAADALAEIVQNLDEVAKDNTDNKEFNFGIEIVDKGNGGNVIFGLATEKYDGKDYLYGAISGPYKKFNGFDLGATVQKILGCRADDPRLVRRENRDPDRRTFGRQRPDPHSGCKECHQPVLHSCGYGAHQECESAGRRLHGRA